MLAILFVLACGTPSKESKKTSDDTGSQPAELVALDPVEQLTRVSMALRGVRPSLADLDRIAADPDALSTLATEYVNTPEFGRTVRDMYAEALLIRRINSSLPEEGEFDGWNRMEREAAMTEEPLALIERVVMDDLPLTEIVTADWTVLDEAAATMWAGHSYDFGAGGEQQVDWTDGRPPAGVLTTNSMLVRWDTNGSNYNRGRANMVSDVFLCESFGGRDIPIDGSVDLSDDSVVADAVQTNPACVACHQALDPVAAHYWGHRTRLTSFQISQAHETGCVRPTDPCYPIQMYTDLQEDHWVDIELRGPGYYGAESDDMETLGFHIADDPRFAQCQAKRFAGYLTQRDIDEVPFAEAASLQATLQDSGFDAKALAVTIVTDPAFLSRSAVDADATEALPGIQIIRPEQLDRMVDDLTGFRFFIATDGREFGDVPMLVDDIIGLRAMSGGVDGLRVTRPTHTPTPIRMMVLRTIAEEAAAHVVSADLALDPSGRVLLTEWTSTDEAQVRAQLVTLHLRILRESVTTDSPQIDASVALWNAALSASDGDESAALTTLVAAFLQTPDVLYY
jgi:hypothetical protein